VLFLAVAASGAQAQTYTVTNLGGSGVSGDGSLRGEVLAANAHSGADVINFAGGLSGTIVFTGAGIVISGPLDIEGPGPAAVSVAQTTAHRVFDIEAIEGKPVTIAGLRVADGTAPSSGANAGFGGDIFNGGATLTLADDVITGGSAEVAGGVSSAKEDGPLVLRDSTVAANKATWAGGVSAGGSAGTWTIQSSTITANHAAEANGGLEAETHGTGLLEDSTISGNTADSSGGASLDAFGGGQIAVRNSTVAENTAAAYAGGLDIGVSPNAAVKIEDSTISANRTVGGEEELAGGIAYLGELGLTLDNTIVAGNEAGIKTGQDIYSEEGTVASAFSLIGQASVGFLAETVPGSDLVGIKDPQLGALAVNGGPTATMALAPTSPAINRGSTALASDQRGLPRPVAYPGIADPSVPGADGADIGAYELQAPATAPIPVPPSNSFSLGFGFGKVKLNKKKGTATVQVNVPGAGEVTLAASKTVKKDSKVASAEATLKLTIKAKGRALKSLRKKGKVKVTAGFTFAPSGGTASSMSKTVKLIKR
jgi:hypothetical protein